MPKGNESFVMRLLPRHPGYVMTVWALAMLAQTARRAATRSMAQDRLQQVDMGREVGLLARGFVVAGNTSCPAVNTFLGAGKRGVVALKSWTRRQLEVAR